MKRLTALTRLFVWLVIGVSQLPTALSQAQTQPAAPPLAWTKRETRLANEYLSLLVEKPEEGRVLDLLWQLYASHGETRLLLDTIAAQAASSPHPSVTLVHAHLLRKSGALPAALARYTEVLTTQPTHLTALRSAASLALDLGQPEIAIAHLTALTAALPPSSPDRAQVWLDLGDLHLSRSQNQPATDCWAKAAAEQPQDLTLIRQVAQRFLQAGLAQQAVAFFSAIAKTAAPTEKLEALLDLSRIQAQADAFDAADAALREGLDLLHFREAQHTEFFRRRVRLHERFDRLPELQTALEQAHANAPTAKQEETLHALVTFFTLTVQAEERTKWLRTLVEAAPQVESYRWDWVRAVLDAGEVTEAIAWLDTRLAAVGSAAPTALVLLRAEADIRSGQTEAAITRLSAFLEAHPGTAAVEKDLQSFATQHHLDALLQRILENRIQRAGAKSEAYFELASHLRSRRQAAAAQAILDRYLNAAQDQTDRLQRLAEITTFLISGSDLDAALLTARSAVALPHAGVDDWLRLADLLIEKDQPTEAESWLDKAWTRAESTEQRLEIDERLFSLLQGETSAARPAPTKTSQEFKLPSVFTGSQFGTEAPASPNALPPALNARLESVLQTARSPTATSAQQLRAAWWALRCERSDAAYEMFQALSFSPSTGQPIELSIEAENLLLELAQIDSNRALTARLLRRQMERDPNQRTRHILRLAEHLLESEQLSRSIARSDEQPALIGDSAVHLLQQELARDPRNEQLLAALSRILLLRQQPEAALQLWKDAAAQASGTAAIPLIERQAELLLTLQDLPAHIAAGIRLLELESDVNRRRESFRRFLDRLTAADARGAELDPTVIRDRLDLVSQALQTAASRHPFDAFYPEAQAHLHTRANDPQAAFAAMKRAYYTAPETPFSLDQLRDAALLVEDLPLAIYFQKQVTAAAAAADVAAESRHLVALLERSFQIEEADQVRLRLERRFAQDTKALTSLCEHYQETGQDEAERRVKEQIVKVRPYDSRARLDLALVCLRLADDEAAQQHLEQLLQSLPPPQSTATEWHQIALPITHLRAKSKRGAASDIADLLDNTSHLDASQLEPLRTYLRYPQEALALLPESTPALRLRAIEELAKLHAARPGPTLTAWHQQWTDAPPQLAQEAVWALFHSHGGAAFDHALAHLLAPHPSLESGFARVWLLLRQQRFATAIQWVNADSDTAPDPLALPKETRRSLFLSALSALVDVPDQAFTESAMTQLAASQVLPHLALDELSRKLADRQRYEPALALGEWLRQNVQTLTIDYTVRLGRLAEAAERWDLARHYLTLAVQQPTAPGRYQGVWDPFVNGVGLLARSAGSRAAKHQALEQAWQHLQKTPASDLTTLRRAVVAGLAGAEAQAVSALDRWVNLHFLANRPMGLRPGGLMPQGSLRFEEAPQAQSLWEETREIGALMSQQGLAPITAATESRLLSRWGHIQLGPRPGYEYHELRTADLIRSLRRTSHPDRLHLIRRWLAPVDMRAESSVELLGELGAKLEAAGLAREALDVYWRLPERAPTNSEYVNWVLRACESALEVEPGKSFSLHLINAVPPFKPPTPGDEALREIHARFLAMDFDLHELRQRAQPAVATTLTLPGRLPPETAYLRELARLLEKLNRPDDALLAWQQFDACFLHHDDDGLEPDIESTLHRAQILLAKGQPQQARTLLQNFPTSDKAGRLEAESLLLQARLDAQANDSSSLRSLMSRAVQHHQTQTITALADLLLAHNLTPQALNLLTQAERSAKDDNARFTLRLEQLTALHRQTTLPTSELQRRLASLFRSQVRDPQAVDLFLERMCLLAAELPIGSDTAHVWVRLLTAQTRSSTDRTLAAAGLACWAAHLSPNHLPTLTQAWQQTAHSDGDRYCIQQAAIRLLAAGRADWSLTTATLAGELPTLRRQGRLLPVMLEAAHTLNDRHRIQEIFAEVLHMPLPGGSQPQQWAQTLVKIQRPDLARELLQRALTQARATDTLQTALAVHWARFLIAQGEFPAAETFILQHDYLLTMEIASLLHDLHRAWGCLPDLPAKTKQYQLPKAIEQDLLWRCNALQLPAP
jgi:hypothetical protein